MIVALLLTQASPDVLVTAQRLDGALRKCVEHRCTPLEDARVSIAAAEAQFRDGRYVQAKYTLAAAIDRNKALAAAEPRAVAAIYEAFATVGLHEGDEKAFRKGVAGQVRTLRDNLPPDDPAVVATASALGDMWVKLGKYVEADGVYSAAQRNALAAGQVKSATLIGFRRVMVAALIGDRARARRMLDEIDARQPPSDVELRKVSRVLRFQLDAREADDATMMALAREVAADQGVKPVLLWSPPVEDGSVASFNRESRKDTLMDIVPDGPSDLAALQWMDVGFWIRPDGRTADVTILRSSKSTPWAPSIVAQIAGRRYAATGGGDASNPAGVYQIERVSKRTRYGTPLKTLVRRRLPAIGFEFLDLTESDPRSPA